MCLPAVFRVCNWNLLITNESSHFISLLSVSLSVCSESDELDEELVEVASHGFTGCLSGVRFNSISPLKAALLHPDSHVIVTGPLAQSSCGSSSAANPHAAETTHSFSGTRSTLNPLYPIKYYIQCTSLGKYPTLCQCGNQSGVSLILFLGCSLDFFMGPLTILLGKQTD